jgi:hypothetical protein
MALLDSDILAVWRDTDQKNYATTVSQLVAKVPNQAAPTLTSVLQANNVSQNESIIIENNSQTEIVNLSTSAASTFTNGIASTGALTVGTGFKIKPDASLEGSVCHLVGNTSNNALLVYPSGTTIDDLSSSPTVTITNAGVATFAGALDAASIDGGVYAE